MKLFNIARSETRQLATAVVLALLLGSTAYAEPITVEFSRGSESPVELDFDLNEEGTGTVMVNTRGCRVCTPFRLNVTSDTRVYLNDEEISILELEIGDNDAFVVWETETLNLRKINIRTSS